MSTSPASVPVPWPSCIENIEPCIRRSIGAAWSSMPAGRPPRLAQLAELGGPGRCPRRRSRRRRPARRGRSRPASSPRPTRPGSRRRPAGRGSSGRSRRRATGRRPAPPPRGPAVGGAGEGSPSAATVLRAMSVASAALTAVALSGAANIACTWPMTIASIWGSTLSRPMPCIICTTWGSTSPPVSPRSSCSISGGGPACRRRRGGRSRRAPRVG